MSINPQDPRFLIGEPGMPVNMGALEPDELAYAVTLLDDGGAEVDFDPEADVLSLENVPHGANLVDYIDNSDLNTLASDLIEDYEADLESRSKWEKVYTEGLDLLGLNFEDRTTPWDGACGVFHPMLTDSVVRFQAQTIQEIFPASGPAKATIAGKVTSEKTRQQQRVVSYMNYVSTKEMVEYRAETEMLLFSLPIAGSAFRKLYHDGTMDRPCAMFVPAYDFIVNYGESDLSTCERATHRMRKSGNWIRKRMVSGFYTDIDLQEPASEETEIEKKTGELTGHEVSTRNNKDYTLLEMQAVIDLVGFEDTIDGEPTGIALPYVVTIEKESKKILSIYRNWLENDPNKNKREHFVHYPYIPGLGFYGLGLVHTIGGLTKSATALLRQLVDAGTLANLPGGLKSRGLRIKGDDSPIMPGEFRDVDVPSGNIRDNIAFLPYKEPSSVLYNLLADIVAEGRRFAGAADAKAADMNNEAPVGTTLAILEREMKVLSAVQARVHAAMGRELVILAGIIKDFGPQEYPYEVDDGATITQDFSDAIDICPVSDPNAGTMAQRIMKYQASLQLATTAPQMYDMPLLHRGMQEALGIENADEIIPTDDDMRPTDPVTETMNIINGVPVKAFIYQDHEAHIAAHMSAAEDPKIKDMVEKMPNAAAVMAAGAAHLSEHLAFLYRHRIEQELGVRLPSPEEALPEDIELRISQLVAPAAAQLTGKARQQQMAEENAKKQEDPIVQMSQKELEIKAQQAQAKAAADMKKIDADLQKARDKEQLEREKLAQARMLETAKLAAKVSSEHMKAEADGKKQTTKDYADGFKLGLEAVKTAVVTEKKPDGSDT